MAMLHGNDLERGNDEMQLPFARGTFVVRLISRDDDDTTTVKMRLATGAKGTSSSSILFPLTIFVLYNLCTCLLYRIDGTIQ